MGDQTLQAELILKVAKLEAEAKKGKTAVKEVKEEMREAGKAASTMQKRTTKALEDIRRRGRETAQAMKRLKETGTELTQGNLLLERAVIRETNAQREQARQARWAEQIRRRATQHLRNHGRALDQNTAAQRRNAQAARATGTNMAELREALAQFGGPLGSLTTNLGKGLGAVGLAAAGIGLAVRSTGDAIRFALEGPVRSARNLAQVLREVRAAQRDISQGRANEAASGMQGMQSDIAFLAGRGGRGARTSSQVAADLALQNGVTMEQVVGAQRGLSRAGIERADYQDAAIAAGATLERLGLGDYQTVVDAVTSGDLPATADADRLAAQVLALQTNGDEEGARLTIQRARERFRGARGQQVDLARQASAQASVRRFRAAESSGGGVAAGAEYDAANPEQARIRAMMADQAEVIEEARVRANALNESAARWAPDMLGGSAMEAAEARRELREAVERQNALLEELVRIQRQNGGRGRRGGN